MALQDAIAAVVALSQKPDAGKRSASGRVTAAPTAHDELTDIADYIHIYLLETPGAAQRRKGKAPMRSIAGVPSAWEGTDEQEAVITALTGLSRDELTALLATIEALAAALAPAPQRRRAGTDTDARTARGTVQAKLITRKKWNAETQQWERRAYGHYLYVRTWATAGGAGKTGRRLKNHYLPGFKALATLYATAEGDERATLALAIMDAYALDEGHEPFPALSALQEQLTGESRALPGA